ncbi:hypothetical protein SDC9_21548 [bioreactor metagenome]|uniref:EamA domain-containing protein n=2 Tax=root TaxID=1 RepID=A0A644U9S3_9ZZZZ
MTEFSRPLLPFEDCMEKLKIKAHAALFASGLLFGANYWIAKGLMPGYMQPMQIIFVRGFAAMLLFWLLSVSLQPLKIHRSDHIKLIICSLLGIAINQICFFTGLSYTSPVDTSLIHAGSPLMVIAFSAIIAGEKVTTSKIAGILAGGAGAILLILQGSGAAAAENQLLGNTLILINITAYSLYLVLVKPLMMKYNAVTVMKWIFLYGFLMVIPFSVKDAFSINWQGFTPSAWLSLGYIVVGTTFLAYLLTTFSLKALSAGVAGYYIYMQPVIAASIGIFMFSEALSMVKIVAAVLIFTGVYLVNRPAAVKTNA